MSRSRKVERVLGARWSFFAICSFSVGLGASMVALPLVAVAAGLTARSIAVLATLSAAAQLCTRFLLPRLLERFADRDLLAVASLLLAASGVIPLRSPGVAAFAVAQVANGIARALFWTSSQNHAITSPGSSVRQLAFVSIANRTGGLVGPVVAGVMVASSGSAALILVAAFGVVAAAGTTRMERREPVSRRPPEVRTRLWTRADVSLGYWLALAAGAWTGLLDSYVPVLLASAGYAEVVIGILVSLISATQLLSVAWLARRPEGDVDVRSIVGAGALLVAGASVPALAVDVAIAALVLMLAGVGAGLTTTLGPAVSTARADALDRGGILSVLGAYRSVGRMSSPSLVASMAGVIGLSAALSGVAAVTAAPALALGVKQVVARREPR